MKKILTGLILGITLAVSFSATSQLMYGNSFPFWDVRGPLTTQTLAVSGNSVLTGNLTVTGTHTQTGVQTFTAAPVVSALTASLPVCTTSGKALSSCTQTGTGTVLVAATSPTLVTPVIGVATGTSLVVSGYYGTAAPRIITSDGAVAATDSYVIANKAGTLTLTLPDPTTAANTGRRLCVKTSQAQTVVSATSNVVPLITGSAAAAILAATAGKWACMVSDATNWVIMEAN